MTNSRSGILNFRIVGYYYGKGRPHYRLSEVPVQKLTYLDREKVEDDFQTPTFITIFIWPFLFALFEMMMSPTTD
jgi:hypothetical protein